MAHLILTTNDLAPFSLQRADRANVVIGFRHRFVSGRPLSETELATSLEARSARHDGIGKHWLDDVNPDRLGGFGSRKIGFFDLCEKFDSIEVWIDPQPNDQLVLVWLLDFLRPHRDVITKLSLVHTDDLIARYHSKAVARWRLPVFKVTDGHLAMASRAWHAYRAPTPKPCYDLLMTDLMILPRLRSALIALLQELPDQLTGLGASEMGMLERIDDGCDEPRVAVGAARLREVFDEREAAERLDELAQCPAPAVIGMGDGPFDMREEARLNRHRKSRVALTELGRAIVAGEDDFSRHNPIRRWWGGTELTGDRLWRWDAATRSLVAP